MTGHIFHKRARRCKRNGSLSRNLMQRDKMDPALLFQLFLFVTNSVKGLGKSTSWT